MSVRSTLRDPWDRRSSFFSDTRRDAHRVTAPEAPAATGRPRPSAGGASEPPAAPRRRRIGLGVAATVVAALAASTLLPMTGASADPSAHTWYRLRMCESSDNYSTNTGNDHYGAYQFDLATWRSVGGSGYPYRASKAEQDARALILYRKRGWQPWQCAGILGLSEDSDAGSGRTGDIHIGSGDGGSSNGGSSNGGSSGGSSSSGVPAFPGGSHWYRYGETSAHIKTFQDQMHKRGYFPVGTGEYGPNTLAMVKQLQRLNGLIPNGYLGPETWRTAWKGRYTPPTTGGSSGTSPTAPSFPGGSHWYFYGERSSQIKVFQDQMHRRGFFPVGTGEYGWNTWHLVTTLQKQNGLVPNGLIGPNTWKLAWTGKYHS